VPNISNKWKRLAALALLVIAAWVLSLTTGLSDSLNKEDLRTMVLDAGPWGVLLFLALYCVGIFVYVPGLVFVAGAVLIYGIWVGLIMAYLGGLLAISTSFIIARKIGGVPLVKVKSARLRSLLAKLHQRPVLVMAALRVFMQASPALNTVLALSGVSYRDYLLGAVFGMWVPVVVTGTAFYYLLW
jgi:uncharacterized membrane protein YdjX (TVP38/TMEM64 family)